MLTTKPISRIVAEADPKVPEVAATKRVQRASDVVSQYQTLFDEDFNAERDRAIVQSQCDGNAPFSESRLRTLGISGVTNVNWGDLRVAQAEAERPFNNILNSMSHFGIVPFKDGVMSPTEASGKVLIVAKELHRMITLWRDFRFRWRLLAHYTVMWGVGFTYRDDDLDWRWRVSSLQDVKVPRGTTASVNEVDRIFMKVDMTPSDLYSKIADAEMGRQAGWNPEQIYQSCVQAMPKPLDTQSPQAMQAMWKDNSLYGGNTNVVVQVVHGFIKEVDGTITHYMVDYSMNSNDAEFLYEKKGKYADMSEFINAYIFGVGTNGDFHSIRGNAFNLFSSASAINRLMCKFMDKAADEANTFLSSENEDATIDSMIVPRGPYFQLSTGVTFAERSTPPVAGNLVPALQAMKEVFRVQSGGMAPRSTGQQDTGQRTKYELQRTDDQDTSITSDVMDMYLEAFGWDYREVVKRVINPDLQAQHPGGAEAFEFRRRCEMQGIPWEQLQHLDYDDIQHNTGLGRGSSTERRVVLGRLNESMYGRLDPEGQAILTRDTIAAETDYRYALMLVPEQAGQRPPIDEQIANNENQIMVLGGVATLVPNQDHEVHVGTHVKVLQSYAEQIQNVQVSLEDSIPKMQVVSEHATEHLQFLDPDSQPYRMYKEALQQFNEVIINGAKHLEAERRKQEEQAQKDGGNPAMEGQPEAAPPGLLVQAADARAKLEMMQRQGETKILLMKREADMKLLTQDAIAAQKIRHAEAMAQARNAKPKTPQAR